MQKWNEWYESSNSRTRNASAAWKNKKETTKGKRGKQMLLSRMTLVITYKQLKIKKHSFTTEELMHNKYK